MKESRINGLTVFQFESLVAFNGLSHGIFGRSGGISRLPYQSLNLGRRVGDDSDAVAENRRRVTAALGGGVWTGIRQVHGSNVVAISADSTAVPEADGMITSALDRILAILVADCQAILLYDPVARVAANLHSGWRGSVGNIIGAAVTAMVNDFHCRSEDIWAGIGPSLGPCCSEFINYRTEIPREWWPYKDNRHHFDFWAMSRDQLRDAGVPEGQIETAGLCTRCRPDLFFSYRHQHDTGRFPAVMALRPESGGPV